MRKLWRHRPRHLYIKTIFHVKLNDCILDWEIEYLALGVKSWRAVVVWMWMPILLLALLGFVHTTGLAQGTKPTQTRTATATETPTVTPTDSLNVFETPSTPTLDPQRIYISNPLDGSLVQGVVNITGKSEVNGFSRYEVEFSYDQNPVNTWFLLLRSDQQVKGGQLTVWDTSSLTDGDYSIRLRVYFADGSWRDAVVSNVKVRNYTSTQTAAPTQTPRSNPTSPPTRTATSTPSPMPTPTLLPSNMAELSMYQVWSSLGRGALATALLFIVFGLILRSRSKRL
jgi:hypothetical protein